MIDLAKLGRPQSLKSAFQTVSADGDLREVAGKSVAAFGAKVSAAVLSFLMFLALARVMTPDEFGRFGFALSLAYFAALIGGLGQRSLVMRFVPVYSSRGDTPRLKCITLTAATIVIVGCSIVGIAIAGTTLAMRPSNPAYLYFAAALTPLVGLADFLSHILRAHGSVLRALVPRDVLWRLLIVCICVPGMIGLEVGHWTGNLDAADALGLASGLLLAVLTLQVISHREFRQSIVSRVTTISEFADWKRVSWGLWGTSIVQTGTPHLAVVLVGFALTPEKTGGLVIAVKVAALLNFFLLSANLVSAPHIARFWHNGEIDRLQRLCSFVSVVATIPTAIGFLFVVVAGPWLLSLFGAAYQSSYWTLVLLSGGYLVHVMCGQTDTLMTMSGKERRLLKILFIVNGLSIFALLLGTPFFGEVFAGFAIALSVVVWNIWVVIVATRSLGVDPSIVGAWRAKNLPSTPRDAPIS